MLDLAGIIFSSVMMLIVIVRAVQTGPRFNPGSSRSSARSSPSHKPKQTWRRKT